FVLADLPLRGEPGGLEHREGAGMKEGRRHHLAGGVLGISLDHPAAERRDLLQCALQRRGGDALLAVTAVAEEAGDAPGRRLAKETLVVGLAVLDPRQLVGRAELAPADAGLALIDERRICPALAHALLFRGPAFGDAQRVGLALGVKAETPTAAENAVVIG